MNKLTAFLDAHLIPEWRQAWTFLSVQWAAISAIAIAGWSALDDSQRTALLGLLGIDPKWVALIGIAVAVYLRLKNQKDAP